MEGKSYFTLGQRAFILGDLQESTKFFSEALRKEYQPARTLLSRGVVFLVAEKNASALEDFNLVLEIDENNERAYYYRGITHLRNQKYQQATADLDASLFLNSKRGTAYFARGLAWTMLGNKDQALADFEQAVALAHLEVRQFAHIFGKEPTMLKRFMDFWENQEASTLPQIFTEMEITEIKSWT